jgi:hypothetical protein
MRFRIVTGLAAATLLAAAAPAAVASTYAAGSNDYKGPFTTAKVPAVCVTSVQQTRYYTTGPPQVTGPAGYFRSGSHGHGGRLACIYFSTEDAAGHVLYGKWLVFDQAAHGWLIPQLGLDVTYVNCALPGYRFPPPPYTGANDCGESWGPGEGAWVYQTGPAAGQPMFPPATP